MPNIEEFPEEKSRKYWPVAGVPYRYKDCTLDSFQGNDKLVADLKSLISEASDIFLTGNTGCGKTHLAIGALKQSDISKIPELQKTEFSDWETAPERYFSTLPEVLLKIRESFRERAAMTEAELVNYFSDIECLVLDDIGSEKPSEFSNATLYLILDRRIRNCRQTIITSNLNIKEIENICGARIASRISEMRIIKINMPDWRKRR